MIKITKKRRKIYILYCYKKINFYICTKIYHVSNKGLICVSWKYL